MKHLKYLFCIIIIAVLFVCNMDFLESWTLPKHSDTGSHPVAPIQTQTRYEFGEVINLAEQPVVMVKKMERTPLATNSYSTYQACEYCLSSLSSDEKKLYRLLVDTLYATMWDYYSDVDYSSSKLIAVLDLSEYNISSDECAHTLWKVLMDYPVFYHVDHSPYTYFGKGEKFLYLMALPDYQNPSNRQAIDSKIKRYEQELLELTQNKMTADKIKIVADYIMDRFTYAEDENHVPIVNDITSTLASVRDDTAVCGGYAYTCSYFMNALGIECLYVTGDVEEGFHAWNYVYIPEVGEWYGVDTCFTDYGAPNILKGKDMLNTHVPENKDHVAGLYYYSYPSLADSDYNDMEQIEDTVIVSPVEEKEKDVVTPKVEKDTENVEKETEKLVEESTPVNRETDDKKSDGNTSDGNTSDGNTSESNASVYDKEDESSYVAQEPSNYSPVINTNTSWSDWTDRLPEGISNMNVEIESKKAYKYTYIDTVTSEQPNNAAIANGYVLKETINGGYTAWSNWSEARPSCDGEIEEKTQYKAVTREYCENAQSNLSGWTWFDSYSVEGWSDWLASYPEGAVAVETRQVENYDKPIYSNKYSYSRYYIYAQNEWHFGPSKSSLAYWKGNPSYESTECAEAKPYYKQSNAGCPMYEDMWYNETCETILTGYETETQYRGKYSSIVNKFYRDIEQNEWVDVKPENAVSLKTRVVYRYREQQKTYVYEKTTKTGWLESKRDDNWMECVEATLFRFRCQ